MSISGSTFSEMNLLTSLAAIILVLHFISDNYVSALYAPFSLGNFNGTVVSDGVYTFCQNPYKVDDKVFEREMLRSRVEVYPHIISENILILDFKGIRLMVDVGTFLPPGSEIKGAYDTGKLLSSMEEAQIPPESIEVILITHVHIDHVTGLLTAEKKATFPNAKVYVPKIDHDLTISNAEDHKKFAELPEHSKVTTEIYYSFFKQYNEKIVLVNDLDSPIPGVIVRLAPGHTLGHSIYEFQDGNTKLTATGDLWHLRELQVRDPSIGFGADADSDMAAESRRVALEILVERGDFLVAFHENFPGIGKVFKEEGRGFDWAFTSLNDLQPGSIETCDQECSNPGQCK